MYSAAGETSDFSSPKDQAGRINEGLCVSFA
jgi:hypothetical protein